MPASAASPPNVVMIISDDQGWGDYGFMGHKTVATPHLDKLAAQSLCFKNGYVTASLCCPSLASMITGRYPHQHGITGNDPSVDRTDTPHTRTPAFAAGRESMKQLIHASPALPRVLGAPPLGYRSLQTGKWWLGSWADGGFTEGMTMGDPAKGGRHGDAGLNIGRRGLEPIFDFVRRTTAGAKPFFVWYAPMMPHQPHDPPEALLAKYLPLTSSPHEARYLAMVEWFDQTCGQLLDFLDREKLADNTLVVYLCDNGWIQKPDAQGFAPKSKQSPYDGGLRTPILLRWPGKITPSMPSSLASSVDLMPTILKACGAPVPAECPGIDLLNPAVAAARGEVFGACFDHDMVDLSEPARSLKWRWCRAGDWKLILPASRLPDARPELYDLATDPGEFHNLAGTESETTRLANLTRLIDAWWKP
ncbi:MAG: sulfatase [Verrucomicrobiota bacterium]